MRIDLSGMTPAPRGVERSVWSSSITYLGGRLHGQTSQPGWHALRRCEFERDLDDEAAGRVPHYRLYLDGSGYPTYVHSSLFPSVPE